VSRLLKTILIIACSLPLCANPAWVSLEQGKSALRKQELFDAMSHFREARNMGLLNADADFYTGIVYEAEQNFTLAKRYYMTAIEQKNTLYNPSDVYLIHYRLARLYWTERDFLKYEYELGRVIDQDREKLEEEKNWDVTIARNVLLDRGFDRLAILFRLPMLPSFFASRELGAYLETSGRDSSLDHLMLAFVQAVTLIVERIHMYRPEFQYETFSETIKIFEQYDRDGEIAGNIAIHKILFYLGLAALNYDDSSNTGERILLFLLEDKTAGTWSRRAANYMENKQKPFLEELEPRFPSPY